MIFLTHGNTMTTQRAIAKLVIADNNGSLLLRLVIHLLSKFLLKAKVIQSAIVQVALNTSTQIQPTITQ